MGTIVLNLDAVPRIALRALLRGATDALANGRKPCATLTLYIVAVAPPAQITPQNKASLIADAMRIRAVIGC